MSSIEASGKTVELAIDNALAQLGLGMDDVEVEILEMGSKGVLGLGKKDARVRVSSKETPASYAMGLLRLVLEKMDLPLQANVSTEENLITIAFSGENMGALIGRRGETLDDLQYLVNLAVSKHFEDKYQIVLDAGDYRKGREQTLNELAHKMAAKAIRSGRDVVLEPMNPYERRIIHMALQEESRVRTFSKGEEPYRKVVIARNRPGGRGGRQERAPRERAAAAEEAEN